MLLKSKQSLLKNENGQTLVQAIFVLPLLFLFLMAIVDFARFYTVQAMLLRSLEEAGSWASTMPYIDQDLRGLTASDYDYQMFREARRRILTKAVEYPLSTIISDYNDPSSQKLVQWRMVDQGVTGGAAPVIYGAMMIRPGERVQAITSTGTEFVTHTLFPSNVDGSLPPQRQEMLQKRLPIEIHAWAEVDFMLPGFGKRIAKAKAIKYRENITKGALPASTGPTLPTTTTSSSSTSSTTSSTSVTSSTTSTTIIDCATQWGAAIGLTRGQFTGTKSYCVHLDAFGSCEITDCLTTGGL